MNNFNMFKAYVQHKVWLKSKFLADNPSEGTKILLYSSESVQNWDNDEGRISPQILDSLKWQFL